MSPTGIQRKGKTRILESKEKQLGPWGKEERKKKDRASPCPTPPSRNKMALYSIHKSTHSFQVIHSPARRGCWPGLFQTLTTSLYVCVPGSYCKFRNNPTPPQHPLAFPLSVQEARRHISVFAHSSQPPSPPTAEMRPFINRPPEISRGRNYS